MLKVAVLEMGLRTVDQCRLFQTLCSVIAKNVDQLNLRALSAFNACKHRLRTNFAMNVKK